MLWSVRLSVRLSHIHHHQGCDCTAGAYCFRRRTRDLSSHKPAALTITLQRHHILTSTAVKLSNVTCIICSLVPCVCVCVCVCLPCRRVWHVVDQSQRGSAATRTLWMTSPARGDVDVWRHRWRHRRDDERRASSVNQSDTRYSNTRLPVTQTSTCKQTATW